MVNIRNKDLNLLVILSVVAEELNLSRASKRLNLSQPAISHALNRLRQEFEDPLFVRASRGLIATPRLLSLLPQVRELLSLSEILYQSGSEFDLKKTEGSLTLAATTYFEIRVISSLVQRMSEQAPRLGLQTRSLQAGFPKEELEQGVVDVAIAAYFEQIPESFRVRSLGKDPFVCVCSAKNPYLKTKRGLPDYLNARHLQIDVPPGLVAPIDAALKAKKLKRELTLRLGNFATPPMLLLQGSLLLTCPESLAERYAEHFDLKVVELPLKIPPLEVQMAWHERNQSDPLQQWFRNLIVEVAKRGE